MKSPLGEKLNIQARDRRGKSILHYAAFNGGLKDIKFCLQRGISIQKQSEDGWTPLHESCAAAQSESTRMLLSQGASPSKESYYRNSTFYSLNVG